MFQRATTSLSSQKTMLKTLINTQSLVRGFAVSATSNNLVNLTVNDKNGIATLTLNRPPVNSLNYELLQDISTALDDVAKNRSKGLILTSVSRQTCNTLHICVYIIYQYDINSCGI